MRLAVFSAFPQELRGMVRGSRAKKTFEKPPLTIFCGAYSSREILLVLTAMGGRNTENAFHRVVAEYRPDFIASVGFGGALFEGAALGELIWASRVLRYKEKDIEAIEVSGAGQIADSLSGRVSMKEGCIVTLSGWMKKSLVIQRLPQGLRLPVCDMETFPLATLSARGGLPFFAVRSITDRANEDIPKEFSDVCDESGNYRLSCALRLIFNKPALVPECIRLGIASKIGATNLWRTVKALCEVL